MSYKTQFQAQWLNDPNFKMWLEEVKGDAMRAYCKLCHHSFSLSNMGKRAITSHSAGAKHKKKIAIATLPLKTFFSTKDTEQAIPASNYHPDPPPVPSISYDSTNISDNLDHSREAPHSTVVKKSDSILKEFVVRENVTKAEILWCIQSVINHRSVRSAARDIKVLQKMFSDSQISEKLTLQKDKISYMIVHGIMPYFREKLSNDLENVHHITVGFDESLNKISQAQQMDFDIRYWDNNKNEVVVRYWSSGFLGHTTAIELMNVFNKEMPLSLRQKIINISMDGPNTNFKLLRDIMTSFKNDNADGGVILQIGSCGLHTMHCSFKVGFVETGWQVVNFLRNLYNLFKNVPARRADYTRISGSRVFPLKFSAIRWLESAAVAHRAIDIIQSVKAYTSGIIVEKASPTCSSFNIVVKCLEDPLLPAKLAFFHTVASDLEPFMREFQSNKPMIPFLYTGLCKTLANVMDRFVRHEILDTAVNPSSIDLEKKENLLFANQIKIGFATESELKKLKNVKELQIFHFRNQCRDCLIKICKKLIARSPLSYKLTKFLSCFDPQIAASSQMLTTKRLKALLLHLVENQWITGVMADQASREFSFMISRPGAIERLKNFERSETRVDHFWKDFIGEFGKNDASNILKVIKMALIVSHGNSSLERGFSVNKEDLIENMGNETLVARRLVYDTVKNLVGEEVHNFEIDKKLVHAARNAKSRYLERKTNKLREDEIKRKDAEKKRHVHLQLKELKAKRAKLIKEKEEQIDNLNEAIKELSNKNT